MVRFIAYFYRLMWMLGIPIMVACIPSVIAIETGKAWVCWFWFLSIPLGMATFMWASENLETLLPKEWRSL